MTGTAQSHVKIPFEEADVNSDVTFVVEDRKLYFNKTLLSLSSPVFEAMLTADFKEKSAREIPLPGKKYADVVAFFKQIHPNHSADPITDTTLPDILSLADEYQTDGVLKRCEHYISHQTNVCILKKEIPDDKLLLYLSMCERHGLTEVRELLLELGTQKKLTDLQKSPHYDSVPLVAMKDLAVRRALNLEACTYGKTWSFIQLFGGRPAISNSPTTCRK